MLQKCMVPVQTETIEDPATEPLKTFISLISLEVGGRKSAALSFTDYRLALVHLYTDVISSLMYTQHLASSCYKNAWYPSRRKQSKIPRPNPSKPSFPWFHLRSVAGSQLHYHLQTIGLPSFTYIPMLSVMYKPSPEKSEGKIRRALFHSVNFNLVYNPNMENWSCDIG